jgi:hypothetical protein
MTFTCSQNEEGFLACNNGIILSTVDGGTTWSAYPIPDFTQNLNAMEFSGTSGFIVSDNGNIVITNDSGLTWNVTQLNEAKVKKYYASLNDIYIKDRTILIAGNDGTILLSRDFGTSFSAKNLKLDNYTECYIESPNSYYIGSDNGKLLHTNDGGVSYDLVLKTGQRINTVHKSGSIIKVAGTGGMFMESTDNGITWAGKSGRGAMYYILNFFAPFAVIWLLFFLMYIAMPNIKVQMKAAALGASFTGAVWVSFIFLFIFYIKQFANGTFAIYGALAAFPIFLLMIYASTLIILFGGELAYTIMFPSTYKNLKKKKKTHDFNSVVNGVKILFHIYKKFENGDGPTTLSELQKLSGYQVDQTDLFLEQFIKNRMLLLKENAYLPATASRNLTLENIVNTVHSFKLESLPPESDPVKTSAWRKIH